MRRERSRNPRLFVVAEALVTNGGAVERHGGESGCAMSQVCWDPGCVNGGLPAPMMSSVVPATTALAGDRSLMRRRSDAAGLVEQHWLAVGQTCAGAAQASLLEHPLGRDMIGFDHGDDAINPQGP